MAKTKISEWSATPANNTDIDGINIAEGCAPSGINDAIREMMAQVKDLYSGTTGDATAIAGGGTGATTASAARTNLGVAVGTDVLPVANPSYTGTLTGGTGVVNIGSGQVYKDSSGNVGIGTSSLSNGVRTVIQGSQTGGAPQTSGTAQTYGLLRLQGTSFTSVLDFGTNGGNYNWIQATDSSNLATNYNLVINPNGGNLLVGTTTNSANTGIVVQCNSGVRSGIGTQTTHSGSNASMYFTNPNGQVGSIITSGSSTNYNTSSDYRLKHDIAPMTGALDRVIALKPVTYKWNADGSDGEGFIAHELAEVVPDAVTGEKDAVKEDGSIKPQGIDTSFLVATLTAAIQELKAIVDAQGAEIAALKGQA